MRKREFEPYLSRLDPAVQKTGRLHSGGVLVNVLGVGAVAGDSWHIVKLDFVKNHPPACFFAADDGPASFLLSRSLGSASSRDLTQDHIAFCKHLHPIAGATS
jgi:hypothetical protein